MAKEKTFKCAFSHCEHNDQIVFGDNVVKINNRYWHKDCYEISMIIRGIIEDYINVYSKTVVITALRKTINNIIFGEKLLNNNIPKYESDLQAAQYLEFAFKYAIDHNIPISYPQGLYYLIDNSKIKEAWKKKTEVVVQREAAKNAKEMDISESKQTTFTINNTNRNNGFGNILNGVINN